jgi:hypothetical protein
MSDLVALKVILANVEARLVVALAEGREMDAGIFGALPRMCTSRQSHWSGRAH